MAQVDLGAAVSKYELNFHIDNAMKDGYCLFKPRVGATREFFYSPEKMSALVNELNLLRYDYADVTINSDQYNDLLDLVGLIRAEYEIYLDGELVRGKTQLNLTFDRKNRTWIIQK